MPRFQIPLILLLSLFTLGTSASETVDRDTWIRHMTITLPDFFCQEEAWFMQCFEISIEQCRNVSRESTSSCLDQFAEALPADIAMPDEGRQWGSQVGFCAGTAYEQRLVKQRIRSERCDDPSQW